MPRVYGGSDDAANLITLCRKCHGHLHGVEWKTLQKAGIAKAKVRRLAVYDRAIAQRAKLRRRSIRSTIMSEASISISRRTGSTFRLTMIFAALRSGGRLGSVNALLANVPSH